MGWCSPCLCTPRQTCTYGLLLHILSKGWAMQKWDGGRLRRMGLGVQPLEKLLAQALRGIATGHLISGFLALLGGALVRSTLTGPYWHYSQLFWGKKNIAHHTTLY